MFKIIIASIHKDKILVIKQMTPSKLEIYNHKIQASLLIFILLLELHVNKIVLQVKYAINITTVPLDIAVLMYNIKFNLK
jgi:hypothetical protein